MVSRIFPNQQDILDAEHTLPKAAASGVQLPVLLWYFLLSTRFQKQNYFHEERILGEGKRKGPVAKVGEDINFVATSSSCQHLVLW